MFRKNSVQRSSNDLWVQWWWLPIQTIAVTADPIRGDVRVSYEAWMLWQVGHNYFRVHPKGKGILCKRKEGIEGFTFIEEYLGTIHMPWRWLEVQVLSSLSNFLSTIFWLNWRDSAYHIEGAIIFRYPEKAIQIFLAEETKSKRFLRGQSWKKIWNRKSVCLMRFLAATLNYSACTLLLSGIIVQCLD